MGMWKSIVMRFLRNRGGRGSELKKKDFELPRITMRANLAEGTLFLDYYDDVSKPGYVTEYCEQFMLLSRQNPVANNLEMSRLPPLLIECSNCLVRILTNRPSESELTCAACDASVPVRGLSDAHTMSLLKKIEVALDLGGGECGGRYLLAFWAKDEAQEAVCVEACNIAGHKTIPVDGPAGKFLRVERMRSLSNTALPFPSSVWLVNLTSNRRAQDGTPVEIAKLLQGIRQATGRLDSMSIELPTGTDSSELVSLLIGDDQSMTDTMRGLVDRDPADAELMQTYVRKLVEENRVEEARRYISLGGQLHGNNPYYWIACGVFYSKLGELERAQNYLLDAVKAMPLDRIARLHLVNVLKARGDHEAADSHARELRALGMP